jgi:hypothetical protein
MVKRAGRFVSLLPSRYRPAVQLLFGLAMAENFVTLGIGYVGRKCWGQCASGSHDLPLMPFFKAGMSQLVAKALMSMSLGTGLSFPVVTLGGASYAIDYTYAILIVVGTSLLSVGKTIHSH